MARTPLRALEDDVREEARKSTAGELVTRRDVIGWFGGAAASLVLPTFVGWVTGSFDAVATYASDQTRLLQLVSWSAAFLLSGVALGIFIRHLAAVRQLKRSIKRFHSEMEEMRAEKDAEIDRLRRNIVGLEDVDHIMRHLPENLGAIIVAIRQRGGSVSMPMSAELRDLVNRHLLYGAEGPRGTFSWSLVPGVVKWFEERGE